MRREPGDVIAFGCLVMAVLTAIQALLIAGDYR